MTFNIVQKILCGKITFCIGKFPFKETLVEQEQHVKLRIPFKIVIYAVDSHIAFLVIDWSISLKSRLDLT